MMAKIVTIEEALRWREERPGYIERALEAGGSLPMWALYERPEDYPDGYVARLWRSIPEPQATALAIGAPDLDAAIAAVESLTRRMWSYLDRMGDDDPKIVGVLL